MNLRDTVYFVGDSYRGDQANNIKRLFEIFSHAVNCHGVKTELCVSDLNKKTGPDSWMAAWVRSLQCKEPSLLKNLDPSTSGVIAFELSCADKLQLDSLGIPWVNFEIHPVRFLEDLYFNVEASFPIEFSRIEIPDDYIWLRAEVLRAKYRSSDVSAGNRLLIVGQTPIDKSIYFDEQFKRLPDYFSALDQVVSDFGEVDYRPHPYLTDSESDAHVRDRYSAGECNDPNIYKVFASGRYRAVCGISSSVLCEAPYFGLTPIALEPRARKFGRPIPYGKLVRDSHLWLGGLLGAAIHERSYDALPPVPENYLRQVYCSWAYVTQEEETKQVLSSIDARTRQSEERTQAAVTSINEIVGMRENAMNEKLGELIEMLRGEEIECRDAVMKAKAESAQMLVQVAVLEERTKGMQEALTRAEATSVELRAEKELCLQQWHEEKNQIQVQTAAYQKDRSRLVAQLDSASEELASSRVSLAQLEMKLAAREQELTAELLEVQRANDHHWRLAEENKKRLAQECERVASLDAERNALLQSNHHHWTLAESRAKEIESLKNQLAELESTRLAACALIQDKQKEVDYWYGRLLQMYASTSWKITKPIRGFKRLINGKIAFQRADIFCATWREFFFNGGRTLVAHAIRYVFLRPRLRRCLSDALKTLPNLHRRLLRVGLSSGAVSPLMHAAGAPKVVGTKPSVKFAGSHQNAGNKIAVLVPGAASGTLGGAERFYSGLVKALSDMGCHADTVCLPVDESSFEGIQQGYKDFANLDLSAYDMVISTKAPTYVATHPNHVLYLVHTVRVFYDMFDDVFPNPTVELLAQRDWIQKTDAEAISRIAKRFAIGAEVSQRLLRWNGIDAEVLHPPMDLHGLYDSGIGDYFFMPGRLHPWKRVDLAIKAVKRSGLPLRLLISGVGEAEQALRDLADGDRRIEFLGRVDDEQLKALYAEALAVPFLPLREDYGYVTLEAFASGKPVVTCIDSGEPNQFVQDGVTGIVCSADEDSLCTAFERLWNDRAFAKKMGEAGRERIKTIRWPAVAGRLLDAGFGGNACQMEREAKKLHVAILDMQPIIPAIGGGRLRLLGLYHALGGNIEARYVGTYDWPGEKFRRHHVTPSLEEIDVPLSQEHHVAAAEAARKAGGKVVIDMLFGQQASLSPAYLEEVNRAVRWADVVVFSHPWVAPLVSDELLQGKVVVYDSHNVEGRLRAQILDSSNPFQNSVLNEVAHAEKLAGDRAELILACSEEDAGGFVRDYCWQKAAMLVVPNGVFSESIQPPTPVQKAEARDRLQLPTDKSGVAFFIGSDYAPNVEAANIILREIAPACPQVQFVIAGGVCSRVDVVSADNVRMVGFVDDSQRLLWLQAADFAINPMCSGSGTNIKMFDFMAAGLPVVSTPIGARGIVDTSTSGIRLAAWTDMPAAIAALLDSPETLAVAGIENRRLVEKRFAWEKISPNLGIQLRSAWVRRKGSDLLKAGGGKSLNRIAHLTTLGTKCGIGEYTKKIVDTLNSNGFKNFVVSCDSAQEQAVPYTSADQFHVGWYFDNKHWMDSHVQPDVIDRVLAWGAHYMLIQYHPGFYSSGTLLDFASRCITQGMATAVVVHNYTGACAAAFSELNRLGVSIFSHSETEISEAAQQGVMLELLPLGVDVREPLIKRDISTRNMQESPPVIVTNGFLRRHKGVRTLIKAMPRILQEFPGAKLRVQCALYPSLDSREELAACEREVETQGLEGVVVFDTRFLDKAEVLEELSKADIAVLPYDSSNEGGSASATDAFAVGLPLIVSDAEIFDAVRHATATVRPEASELAELILDILSSQVRYKELADASSGFAARNSWDNVAGSFVALM